MKGMIPVKKIVIACCALSAAIAFAEPSWVAVNTAAYQKDAAPSDSNAGRYMAYYCTAEAAFDLFGSTAVDVVTGNVASDFAGGKAKLSGAKSGVGLLSQPYYDTLDLQYVFKENYLPGTTTDACLAIVLYSSGSDQAVRVLGNLTASGDNCVFDDTVGDAAKIGSWTAAANVPEPTSGLLALLGLAALALKRKRA